MKNCKVVMDCTSHYLVFYIHSIFKKFLEHCHIKKMQVEAPSCEIEAAEKLEKNTEDLLHVDLSENYTCEYHDDIQSAYWQQYQLSPFTAALWCSSTFHTIVMATLCTQRIPW